MRAHEAALRAIAEDRTPCKTCGKPHELRGHVPATKTSTGIAGTWADPIDLHPYDRMRPADYARSVLESTSEARS